MGKIQSFSTWLEAQSALALDKTQDYVPSQQSQMMASTGNWASDKTVDYRPGSSQPVDPDIAQSAQNLKSIYSQLTDIFAKAREKAQAFRYPKMKAAFDRELIAGIDGVGRAHAIILPSARGIE